MRGEEKREKDGVRTECRLGCLRGADPSRWPLRELHPRSEADIVPQGLQKHPVTAIRRSGRAERTDKDRLCPRIGKRPEEQENSDAPSDSQIDHPGHTSTDAELYTAQEVEVYLALRQSQAVSVNRRSQGLSALCRERTGCKGHSGLLKPTPPPIPLQGPRLDLAA